jgi:hypothetical protein
MVPLFRERVDTNPIRISPIKESKRKRMFTRISNLFMFVLLVSTASCGAPAAAWVADEQLYPAYYPSYETEIVLNNERHNSYDCWVYVMKPASLHDQV